MKKKNTIGNLAARLALAGAAIFSPTSQIAEAKVLSVSGTETSVPGTKSTEAKKERTGQGIETNQMTGGLDFDIPRMWANPNPIYIPKKHTKQTYRSQQRAAKARRK